MIKKASIIGLGGAGCNFVNRIDWIEHKCLYGVSDKEEYLSRCNATVENKLLLREDMDIQTIDEFTKKITSETVIIVLGLSGSNTIFLQRIIDSVKKRNKKIIIFGYYPFRFEAKEKKDRAKRIWDMLINNTEIDRFVCFNNNQLLKLVTRKSTLDEALSLADCISREVLKRVSNNPSGLNYDIKCYKSGEFNIEECADMDVVVKSSKFGAIFAKLE